MEFFLKTKAVKLRGHNGKYLVADANKNVRQSRNSSSSRAVWVVETVQLNALVIRLRSCQGEYLTSSEVPFLLGMTGKRVVQSVPESKWDARVEWEPVRDGFQAKLRTFGGKFLRANGGPPPWRNSVTHDNPTSATEGWIIWDVEAIVPPNNASSIDRLRPSMSSLSFASDDSSEPQTPLRSSLSSTSPTIQQGMEIFRKAKAVRLRSHHSKFLYADDDEETVSQDRSGSSINARWSVDFVAGEDNFIVLKSCHGKYLTASNQPFFLGATGRKVLQTTPQRLGSSVQWEPVREGEYIKLGTPYGKFLRGNGGVPPWRNSVTHDLPHRSATQNWVLWSVDVLDIRVESARPMIPPPSVTQTAATVSGIPRSETSRPSTPPLSRQDSTSSVASSPPRADGRTIYYSVADEMHDLNDESMEELSITFKGSGVDELTRILEEDTGIDDIIVCARSPLNGNLYPLRLQLPPNQTDMHVVVVPSSSRAARNFT